MELNFINQFIQKYIEFKEYLTKKLNNNFNKLEGETCYLIDNDWMEELLLIYNKYNDYKEYMHSYISKSNINNPIFISDISKVNNYIKNHKKFVIIGDKIMQTFNKKILNDKKLFIIYIGFNKMIIEDLQHSDSAFIYSNPLDEDVSKREGFIFQTNGNNKKGIFEFYLGNEYKNKINRIIRDNYFVDNKFLSSKIKLSFIDELKLKISIMLFYYEKCFLSPKNEFSLYQKYYLINDKWIDAFKKYIKYKEVSDLLNKYDKKLKNKIYYNNINIDKILKEFYNNLINDNNKVNFEEKNYDNYMINKLTPSKLYINNNIPYYTDCYIIHYKILDLIKQLNSNIKIYNSIKVFSKINDKNILLFVENKTINIGNFHNELFRTKYIISYNLSEGLENELNILLDTELNEYFMKNNCDNQKAMIQNLEENNFVKGKLIILDFQNNNEYFHFANNNPYKNKNNNRFNSYKNSKDINKKKIKPKLNNSTINITSNNENEKKINTILREYNLMKNKEHQYELTIKEKEKKENIYLKIIEESKKKEKEYNKRLEEYKEKEKQNKEKDDELKKIKEELNEKLNNLEEYKAKISELTNLQEKHENEKKKYIEKNQYLNLKNMELQQRNTELEIKNKYNENKLKQNKINLNQIQINPQESVFPQLIGLNKVGGIPYMNSILQCLSNTTKLSNYFLAKSNIIKSCNEDEYELSKSYLMLIEHLWNGNKNKKYDPYNFRNVVLSYEKSFNKSNSEKIKDFIDFILEHLHQELKNKEVNKMSEINMIQNDFDKEIIYNKFIGKFNKEKSIISELFFGILQTSYECLECNDNLMYYNYEILKYIIFPLEEIKNTINSKNNKITIDDCFNTIYNNNIFIEEKNNYCYSCKKLTKCKNYFKLLKLPDILIIILKRNINKMYPIEFIFDKEINIMQNIYENNNGLNIPYELYGVVTCINYNEPTEEHFISFCKNNNKWYKYHDIEVSKPINDIQKDILEYKTPIILFYKKF